MLRFVAEAKDGCEIEIKNPLTVVMNSDIGVPADDISITMPFDKAFSELARITVYKQDSVVFAGVIDEIINLIADSQAVTKITARGPAGIMLDNEAEPVTYVNPVSSFIFNRHLKPFGIQSYDADETPLYSSFSIEKGMTHWQVFEKFCRNKYGVLPRITGNGKAMFKGCKDDRQIKFGSGEDIDYISIKESLKPCRLISEVKLKLDEFGDYSSKIANNNSDCQGVTRVRYVNATADNATIKTADRIIELGNTDSYSLVLECAGCHLDITGRSAVLNDRLVGSIGGLRVAGIKYTLGRGGEFTSIMLRKESF